MYQPGPASDVNGGSDKENYVMQSQGSVPSGKLSMQGIQGMEPPKPRKKKSQKQDDAKII